MDKKSKRAAVKKIKANIESAGTVIVVHNEGLNVAEVTNLRAKCREIDATFVVTKNSLAKLALKGTNYEDLSSYFTGPTAIACSEDPISAAKAVVEFANKNDKLVILGGIADNKQVDVDNIKTLAKLPSLDELRSKIVGIISTPATRIATIAKAPAQQLARVMDAYSKK